MKLRYLHSDFNYNLNVEVQFEDLREYKEIRAAILAFAENIGKILFCATNKNYDDEGCILYEAPYIIRSFKG